MTEFRTYRGLIDFRSGVAFYFFSDTLLSGRTLNIPAMDVIEFKKHRCI